MTRLFAFNHCKEIEKKVVKRVVWLTRKSNFINIWLRNKENQWMNSSSAVPMGKWANLECEGDFQFNCKLSNERNWFIARGHVAVAPSFDKSRENFHLSRGITRVSSEFFFQFSILHPRRVLSTSTFPDSLERFLAQVKSCHNLLHFFYVHSEVGVVSSLAVAVISRVKIESKRISDFYCQTSPEEGKIWKINHRISRRCSDLKYFLI